MNILFLNSGIPNYLVDGLFHGFRSIPGVNVVDVPRMDYMYKDASQEDLRKTGSKGNTLYGLLPEDEFSRGKRTFWISSIQDYDLVIFTDLHEQCELFHYLYCSQNLSRNQFCIIDGYDTTSMFPFFHNWFNLRVRPWTYFFEYRKVNVFKREFQDLGELYGVQKNKFPLLNKLAKLFLKLPDNYQRISMSIPEIHIEEIPFSQKTKDFVDYNVDPALDELFQSRETAVIGKWSPSFEKQDDYYRDISASRFGITTKREGWDCLRHYEYAAKGAILCFKNLLDKNPLCAPHALNASNCILYTDKNDLLAAIETKTERELEDIQAKQYQWIRDFTTTKVALRFLDKIEGNKVNASYYLVS